MTMYLQDNDIMEPPMTPVLETSKSMMKSLKITLIGLFSLAIFSSSAFAQITTSDAESFTEALVAELGQIAKDESLSDDAQDQAYRGALKSRLASESIGTFLFKGVPEDLPTPAQIDSYNALFPDYISAAFAAQIGGLAERQINVTQSKARGTRDVIVRSELVNSAGLKKASIDWRIRDIDGKPRLLDVLVERSSPLVTKRQEFSSLVKREGVDALLAHMETIAN